MKRRKRGYPCVRVVPTLVYRRIPVVCDLMPGLEVGEVGQRGKPSVSKKTKKWNGMCNARKKKKKKKKNRRITGRFRGKHPWICFQPVVAVGTCDWEVVGVLDRALRPAGRPSQTKIGPADGCNV